MKRSIPLAYSKQCSTKYCRAVKNSAVKDSSEIKEERKKPLHGGCRGLVPFHCMGDLAAEPGVDDNLSGRFSSGFVTDVHGQQGKQYQMERLQAGRDEKRHWRERHLCVCLSLYENGESRGKHAWQSPGADN